MFLPLVTPDQSDSAYLDNMVEMLVHADRSLPHDYDDAYSLEAWDGNEIMEDYKKHFYEFPCLRNGAMGWTSFYLTHTDGKNYRSYSGQKMDQALQDFVLPDDIVVCGIGVWRIAQDPKLKL